MTERSDVGLFNLESGRFKRGGLAIALVGACGAAAVHLTSPAAATSPTTRACPPASVVNAALGLHGGAPMATTTPYGKTCTYPGKGAIYSTKITFQMDTASTFAASEKAAAGALRGSVVKVQHLGQAAWGTNPGSLYVFDGHETIKILALLTPTSMLEVLARKLL
jgi:hypothetical protein